jgi:hypothetical protein
MPLLIPAKRPTNWRTVFNSSKVRLYLQVDGSLSPGIPQHSNIPTFQHSNIPTFQHSNTPFLQDYKITGFSPIRPFFHCRIVELSHSSNIPLFHFSTLPFFQLSNLPTFHTTHAIKHTKTQIAGKENPLFLQKN